MGTLGVSTDAFLFSQTNPVLSSTVLPGSHPECSLPVHTACTPSDGSFRAIPLGCQWPMHHHRWSWVTAQQVRSRILSLKASCSGNWVSHFRGSQMSPQSTPPFHSLSLHPSCLTHGSYFFRILQRCHVQERKKKIERDSI